MTQEAFQSISVKPPSSKPFLFRIRLLSQPVSRPRLLGYSAHGVRRRA